MIFLQILLGSIYVGLLLFALRKGFQYGNYLRDLGEKYHFYPNTQFLVFSKEFNQTISKEEKEMLYKLRVRAFVSLAIMMGAALLATLLLRFIFSFFIEL